MYRFLGPEGLILYDVLNFFSAVVLLIFNLTQIRKKRLLLSSVSQLCAVRFKDNRFLSRIGVITVIEIVVISLFQYGLAPNINIAFGDIVGTSGNYFGLLFFMPFLLYIVFYLIGVDPLKQSDLITPAYPLALVFVKLACFCAGCCSGIECSSGFYNPDSGLVEFPLQLVEAGLALLIFILLLILRNKVREGTLLPVYIILYSVTRFFSEFLSNKPDIIWRLKTYHILCIVGLAVGIIELICVLKFGDKIKDVYSKNNIVTLYNGARQSIAHKKAERKKAKKKIYQKYK